jgi:hypothetical protein
MEVNFILFGLGPDEYSLGLLIRKNQSYISVLYPDHIGFAQQKKTASCEAAFSSFWV